MQFTTVPPPNGFVPSLACTDSRMVAPECKLKARNLHSWLTDLAAFPDVSPYSGSICSVNQNVVIITKHAPGGTIYIPIDDRLSSCCRQFYRRSEKDGNGYALAEIYLVMKSENEFIGMLLEGAGVLSEMQRQLTSVNFANSPLGPFTRLVSQLQKNIKVSRQGKLLMPIKSGQQHLEDAHIVDIRPWYYGASSYPGYYTMKVSLFDFGGCVLPTSGTTLELLEIIGLE